MTIEEINRIPMVFIVGMGRSGTTLLRTILDASDECLFMPEAKVIVHLKQKYNHQKTWSTRLLDELIIDLYKEVKFSQTWNIDKDELRNKFLDLPIDKISFPLLCKIIYLSYPSLFPKNNIKILGDKNPVYSIFIPELMEIFPDAKFIHIVRDYRDCIYSNKRLFKRQNVSTLAQLWKIYNSWIDSYARKYPSQFFLLRYESLTEEPEIAVKEICKFLSLNFESKMLDFHQRITDNFDKEKNIVINRMHPNLLKKINSENIGKWKSGLNENEQKYIAYILEEYGLKYNYKKNAIYTGQKFLFRSMFGFWVNMKDILIIKGYFILPFFVRDIISKFSRFLFDKTGYYTIYNTSNLMRDLVKKKEEEEKMKNGNG